MNLKKQFPLKSGLLVLGAAAALMLVSCGKTDDPKVLARIGDHRITVDDFKREVERRQASRKPVPEKETLLLELTTFEALLQRARAAGLADDPQVQREIGRMLIGKLQERELAPKLEALTVTETEVRAEYDLNLARYTQPAKARLAILLLQSNPGASEAKRKETRDRLIEARGRILENPVVAGRSPAATGFGQLAVEFSDDQASRYRGGDIGWLELGNLSYRWPRPVLETGYKLEKGQVSEIIEADGGLYLVMKSDQRDSVVTPFDQVHATLSQSLLVKKRRAMEEGFREEARRLAAVEMDLKMLATVELPQSEATLARHQPSEPPGLPGGNDSTNGQ